MHSLLPPLQRTGSQKLHMQVLFHVLLHQPARSWSLLPFPSSDSCSFIPDFTHTTISGAFSKITLLGEDELAQVSSFLIQLSPCCILFKIFLQEKLQRRSTPCSQLLFPVSLIWVWTPGVFQGLLNLEWCTPGAAHGDGPGHYKWEQIQELWHNTPAQARNGRIKELKQVDDKMNLQKNNWHSYKTRKYINNCLQKFVTHMVLGPAGSKKNFLTKTSLQPQNISTKFQAITSKHRIHLLIQKKSLMFYH